MNRKLVASSHGRRLFPASLADGLQPVQDDSCQDFFDSLQPPPPVTGGWRRFSD